MKSPKQTNMDGSDSWRKYLKSGSFRRKLEKYENFELDDDCEPSTSKHVIAESSQKIALDIDTHMRVDGEQLSQQNQSAAVNDVYSDHCSDSEEVLEVSHDYSPDDTSELEDNTQDLATFLQNWSLEHNIAHSALKPLLNRLSNVDRTLPTDPRRLLGTPRKEPELINIEGGQYWHQGLGKHSLILHKNF